MTTRRNRRERIIRSCTYLLRRPLTRALLHWAVPRTSRRRSCGETALNLPASPRADFDGLMKPSGSGGVADLRSPAAVMTMRRPRCRGELDAHSRASHRAALPRRAPARRRASQASSTRNRTLPRRVQPRCVVRATAGHRHRQRTGCDSAGDTRTPPPSRRRRGLHNPVRLVGRPSGVAASSRSGVHRLTTHDDPSSGNLETRTQESPHDRGSFPGRDVRDIPPFTPSARLWLSTAPRQPARRR